MSSAVQTKQTFPSEVCILIDLWFNSCSADGDHGGRRGLKSQELSDLQSRAGGQGCIHECWVVFADEEPKINSEMQSLWFIQFISPQFAQKHQSGPHRWCELICLHLSMSSLLGLRSCSSSMGCLSVMVLCSMHLVFLQVRPERSSWKHFHFRVEKHLLSFSVR